MPNAPAATLANGCVVKVGDVVPMTDGTERKVVEVENSPRSRLRVCLDYAVDGRVSCLWHRGDGVCFGCEELAAIDLAMLASAQAAATAHADAIS